MQKICAQCKIEQPSTAFYTDRSRNSGLASYCKACTKTDNQEWRKANPRRATANVIRHNRRLRSQIISEYGGRCVCCGEARQEFLSLDHKAGGGSAHRRVVSNGRAGTAFYSWIRSKGFPKIGYRLLCHNCNFARGHYGICPHEQEIISTAS